MIKAMKKKLHETLRIGGIVVLSFFLARFLVFDITLISFFAPADKSTDFRSVDFYQIVENSLVGEKQYCPEVLLIGVDSLSRNEITSVIEEVGQCHPKLIGIDIEWAHAEPTDSRLREVLAELRCPVVVPDTSSYIYRDVTGLLKGDVSFNDNCIRSITIPNSFSERIALLLKPDIKINNRRISPIRYGHYEFIDTIKPHSISQSSSIIEGKAILIGALTDLSDCHNTPVDAHMPGLMIHANNIATLLDATAPGYAPRWIENLLALATCTIFVIFNLISKKWIGGGLAMRLIQILFLLAIIIFGTITYLLGGASIDFTRPLLTVVAAAFAVDIWVGAEELYKRHKEKSQNNASNEKKSRNCVKLARHLLLKYKRRIARAQRAGERDGDKSARTSGQESGNCERKD